MDNALAVQALADFVARYSGIHIQSTSATVVNFAGTLYNVSGSTSDPKIDGETWKQLLISYGINGNCYVTSPLPTGASSHPGFNVGGHMTVNSNGSVPTGGTCYLMPLCSWHNSTSKNGIPFAHTQQTMLQLSGYMQGDLAATFLARMPGDALLRLIELKDDQLAARSVEDTDMSTLQAATVVDAEGVVKPAPYVLFRQVERDGAMFYVIDGARLP